MSIDLDVEMIVPQQSEQSVPVFKDVSVIVNHFLKNGVLIKRVEALGREAMVFNGTGSEIANRYKTEFDILNAFFVTFTPKTPEDYLCLIGNDQIDFYSQDANGGICCPIALPFKICCAHPCSFGIILERSSFPGEYGNPPGAAQLFSLTHPYNEIMPILCKFKGDSGCHYTFRGKRMAVVSKDIAANWCSSFFGPIDLLMCYDFDERRNNLFLIRKCTKEERLAAKNDLGVLNSSALMHTPSTVRSFYSPNFFNRRFAENRLATIGLLNAQKNNTDTHLHQSPASCFNPILFGNSNGSSHLHPASQTTSASMTSSVPNTAPSKTPITRRITRSMAAAAATAEFSNHTFGMGALSSLPSSTADKSGSFHRSLEHNAALNRMRLKQKLSLAAGSNAVSNAYINNSTPRHAHSISAADMDDLLSFGGRETDDEPPSSLIMAVEFCLDWLWSEPLPPPIDDAYANRSGSTSSVIAQKLETLRVSSSTSSQSDEATNKINNANRMASTFFISRQALSRSERCIVFHITSDRRVLVLNIHFPKALEDSSSILVPDPIITENGSPSSFIRGDAAVPFLHAPFFMVLVNFSFTDSPTASSIALYTGCTKIANIALNIGIPHVINGNACSNLLRLLPGGLCANGYNQYELRVFVEHEDASPRDDAFRNTSFTLFSYKFQLGFNTRLANRCLMTICSWIGISRQLQFLSRLFCSNPWKITIEAQKIPFVDEVPIECIELALLFEQIFEEFCYDQKDMPFQKLLVRIRSNEEDGEEREIKRTRQNTQSIEDILNNDQYWLMLSADRQIAIDVLSLMNNLKGIKFMNERLLERIRRMIRDSNRPRITNFSFDDGKKLTEKLINDAHKWISAPIWTSDLRVYNVQQMLDSSQPILIPSKDLGQASNEVQQREQHEQFLLSVAIRTVARPFGRAVLNFRSRHAFKENEANLETKSKQKDENRNKNFGGSSNYSQMGVHPICLNGRVHPGWHQIDFPLNDTNPSHKLAMDWANFYNGLAHGFSYCGGFPSRIFSSIIKEEGNSDLSTTVRAGLLLAAGLTGCVRNTMNLYDIHALLTQNDKYLVIALLIGCAAAHRGTSEVHVYKMISAHLPFLLQPTLVEFKIELCIQTAAIVSLGLLFAETANHNVSSQLLNQISLEVPCESDQAFERYSFVLTAGMAVGLINLGKGKEITDTEIPISSTPSLKERLIKLLNGGERRLAYLSYDRVECPGMHIGNFASSGSGGSNLIYSLRRYTPGGSAMDGIGAVNGNGNNAGSSSNNATTQQQHQNPTSISSRDYSGIGQPMSNHVRELPTLNIHLTSPAAAVALGLMYLRTKDEWIYEALSVKDSFYEIDKIRPDMLMIRTFCRCLVKFDDIQPTKQWTEKQIPEIVRRYSQHFVEAQTLEDIWWEEFIDVETISKVHFYCTAGALLALSLRFASSCQKDALSLIHQLYERISSIDLNQKKVDEQLSWSGFASRAGRNCIRTCTNVCALAMGLLMAGSGDLQTTRILRKIRNILPFEDTNIKNKSSNCIPPKDSSVHSLHVSTNMALGLLYFGYGRYRLSDSNLSIAALVLSLFPLFPHSITDNRFYFQPLRFLWILAAEKNSHPKCLRKLSRGRKIRKIINNVEKEGEDEQEIITVDCSRCGRIEITKNERFSSL